MKYGDCAWPTVAPSALAVGEHWPVPAALTVDRIETMCQAWQAAAMRALSAGFKIIEVHMAHGYLLHQFLSTTTNLRRDEYGGELENRMRFPLQVAAAVREVWPESLPMFVRISAVDDGWSLEDSIDLSKALKAKGIDLVDCSSGGIGRSSKGMRPPRWFGFQVPYAADIRRDAQIRTMAVGLILEPDLANSIIVQGGADLVAIGREALVNPNWPLWARKELLQDSDSFQAWPNQYGVWLDQRQRVITKILKLDK
jgi:2,4-dienoyl-CoA reductase-like NADH-dependent reductase (Old Yellow Enzyme family)